MVVRRAVWDQVGPFDTGYRFYCQDLDLCRAATAVGWMVEILPKFKIPHLHGGTVSEEPGSVGSQHPELMLTDLLRFANKHWDPHRARSSIRAMRMGAALRVIGRKIASPLIGDDRREAWSDDTATYAQALRALDREDHAEQGQTT